MPEIAKRAMKGGDPLYPIHKLMNEKPVHEAAENTLLNNLKHKSHAAAMQTVLSGLGADENTADDIAGKSDRQCFVPLVRSVPYVISRK